MLNKPQKIIMLGQTNVGKTAILQTFITKKCPEKTSTTLGSSFHRYNYLDSQGQQIVMDLWDTAGQQKYRSLLTLYYKNSDGVIITFDLSDQTSFQAVKYWSRQLQQNCQFPPCVILVGNKSDLVQSGKGVPQKQVNKFLASQKQWKYIAASAKQNKNIKKIFQTIGLMIKRSTQKRKQSKIKQKTKISKNKLGSSISAGRDKSCC